MSGEQLVDSGDNLTYTSSNTNWIDTYHGRLSDENLSSLTLYRVSVTVDSNSVTEVDPHSGQGDYTVDYANGSVVFQTAQAPAAVVEANYHYATTSTWTMAPTSGKVLRISNVEVQFSTDIILQDSVLFQAYGYVDVFAPHLMTTADPPGPLPPGTKIPLGDAKMYKTMQDYINDAQGSHPLVPAVGGGGWRGMDSDLIIFRWPYKERGSTDLVSSYGMEIRISLEHDQQFSGGKAIATFHSVSVPEESYV